MVRGEVLAKRGKHHPDVFGHRCKRQKSITQTLLCICKKKDLDQNPKLWEQ